jgi:hypothetical protein
MMGRKPLPASPVPAAFAGEIDGFISFLELERGLSRLTCES